MEDGLDEKIKKLESDLKKSRKKEAGDGDDAMVRLHSYSYEVI